MASRAATEYCRKKFYPAGGFFNGHQLGDKRGVVCLGRNSLVSDRVSATDRITAVQAAQPGHRPVGAVVSERSRGALIAQAGIGATSPPPAAVPTPAPATTMFYVIEADGSLSEYRHDNPESGVAPARFAPSSSGWNNFTAAIPGGGNHFYARAQNGDLLWFQHDGFNDGAASWRGPGKIGNGWQSFQQIVGGGDGILYAIAPDGTLMWYRHAGFANGDARAWLGPKKIGSGWQSFKQVFSAGKGVIYAITTDGKLMHYRHLDPLGGEMRWSGPTQVGTGWQGFAQVFSTGNGVIYGPPPRAACLTTATSTWDAATPTFKWVGPVAAGENFNPDAKIIALLP